MIGSGKSSYALNAAKKGFVIISDDSIVESVHGGDYTLYDKSCQPIYKAVSANILMSALAIGKSVIVDVGNRTRAVRQRWIGLAHMYDVPAYAIHFEKTDPKTHAQRRYDSDPRGLSYEKWLEVAHRHHDIFESVRDSEGFKDEVLASWKEIQSGYTFIP